MGEGRVVDVTLPFVSFVICHLSFGTRRRCEGGSFLVKLESVGSLSLFLALARNLILSQTRDFPRIYRSPLELRPYHQFDKSLRRRAA